MPGKAFNYQWKDTVDFVKGQRMEFTWTFENGTNYRFEVNGTTWTGIVIMKFKYPSGLGDSGLVDDAPPWVWELPAYYFGVYPFNETRAIELFFATEAFPNQADTAEQVAHVNIYERSRTETADRTSRPYDHLLYVGMSAAAMGAAIIGIGAVYPVHKVEKNLAHAEHPRKTNEQPLELQSES